VHGACAALMASANFRMEIVAGLSLGFRMASAWLLQALCAHGFHGFFHGFCMASAVLSQTSQLRAEEEAQRA